MRGERPPRPTGSGHGRQSALGDLAMGARFALAGGREGWTRLLLTAVGVGLGVALLLVTTAIPSAVAAREARGHARADIFQQVEQPGPDTLLVGATDTEFHGRSIRGRMLRAEGPNAPVPPGLTKLPAPGEMVVSPALAEVLAAGGNGLLRERLPYRQVGVIADEGLSGPGELAYYAGNGTLAVERGQVYRIDAFGYDNPAQPFDPVLMLLVLIMFVALLMPVAVFIAAAIRFGGDRRDRRLAALRLVGADRGAVRRIAVGEALTGALLGLVLGAGFFLVGRNLVGSVTAFEITLFPADLDPSLPLVLLVLLAVPAAAAGVTLLTLRGVAVEPLGVVRTARPARRRLWWRLLAPVAGLALLVPLAVRGSGGGPFNEVQVIGGATLLLTGVVALLPWLIEAVVTRLRGSGVAWQLAVRRLQMSSGTAARLVSGIAVAVAGAIGLQMFFAGIQSDYRQDTGGDPRRAHLQVSGHPAAGWEVPRDITRRVRATEGVRQAYTLVGTTAAPTPRDPEQRLSVTVADCDALRETAQLPSCADGDVFRVDSGRPRPDESLELARPGERLYLGRSFDGQGSRPVAWTLPERIGTARPRADASGYERGGLLATPGALRTTGEPEVRYTMMVRLDESDPEAVERVRTTIARTDPLAQVFGVEAYTYASRFANVRQVLFAGAAAVLALIGASMLVSQLEQLRERRKLLAALVAFGTKRSTLGWSVLWQSAIPVALGLVLAAATGVGLGAVLLTMVGRPVVPDWPGLAAMTGIGGGVVLLVTALSLPPLWRMLRPEGLRTE
ncbi:FtsX-like permease family protein [Streptomyces sp. URMC 123]|uniref:FtsX-like permease family protein n=1 Tax=Streptomyces sp. URMC 123 TaxID=3423403 RepID=UPI003F1DDCB3